MRKRTKTRLVVALLAACWVLAIGVVYVMTRPKTVRIPVSAKSYTERDLDADMLRFYRRTMPEAYASVGVRNPAWDEAAPRYLEANALRFARQPEAPSLEALVADGKALTDLGCTDPMVAYCYGTALSLTGRTEEAAAALERAVQGFMDVRYPRARACVAPMWLAEACQKLGGEKAKEVDHWRDLGIYWFGQAAGEVSAKDRESRCLLAMAISRWNGILADQWMPLYHAVHLNKQADPYIVEVIGGMAETEEAWKSRGTEWGYEVTPEGLKGFKEHLAEAHAHLVKACDLQPAFPEAPAAMIKVATGESKLAHGARQRMWFERAVNAQLDYDPAYRSLLWGMRPRWGGSTEEMYRFGEACLDTKRYDTQAPLWFLHSLHGIWDEEGHDWSIWQREGVYARLQQMFAGYLKAAKTEQQKDYYRTLQAECAWACDEYEEARKLLDQLGERAQARVLTDWDLEIGLEEMRGQVYAYAGPAGEQVKRADDLRDQGKLKESREAFASALAATKEKDAVAYLQQQLADVTSEERLENGQWVSIMPGEEFTGWDSREGKWELEPDGSLKGTATKDGLWLMGTRDFGGRIELAGEVEFVSCTNPARSEAAVFVDVTQDPEYDYFDLRLLQGGQSVTVERKAVRRQERSQPAAITPRTAFLVQLWDHTVGVSVNGQPVLPMVQTKQKGEPPLTIGIGSYAGKQGIVLRFRNLQLRRLKQSPFPPETTPMLLERHPRARRGR